MFVGGDQEASSFGESTACSSFGAKEVSSSYVSPELLWSSAQEGEEAEDEVRGRSPQRELREVRRLLLPIPTQSSIPTLSPPTRHAASMLSGSGGLEILCAKEASVRGGVAMRMGLVDKRKSLAPRGDWWNL